MSFDQFIVLYRFIKKRKLIENTARNLEHVQLESRQLGPHATEQPVCVSPLGCQRTTCRGEASEEAVSRVPACVLLSLERETVPIRKFQSFARVVAVRLYVIFAQLLSWVSVFNDVLRGLILMIPYAGASAVKSGAAAFRGFYLFCESLIR